MKNIWIFPDREQNSNSISTDGDRIASLTELIDVTEIPKAIILGIPQELITKHIGEKFIFAEYARMNNGQNLLSLSTIAGADKDNRIVYLTNLQIFSQNEKYSIPPIKTENFPEIENKYFDEFLDENSSIYDPVKIMLKNIDNNKHLTTFSSENLYQVTDKHDWMPKKKDRKKRLIVFAILFLSCLITILMINR